jgi:hypothetical protein
LSKDACSAVKRRISSQALEGFALRCRSHATHQTYLTHPTHPTYLTHQTYQTHPTYQTYPTHQTYPTYQTHATYLARSGNANTYSALPFSG